MAAGLLLPLSLLLLLLAAVAGAQTLLGGDSAQPLSPTPTYLLLVPRKFRAGQELRVSASVFRLLYDSLTFRVSIRRRADDGSDSEIAFAEETFQRTGSRIVGVKIPEAVYPGNFSLLTEGSVRSLGGLVFSNWTEILYEPRLFSAFIQFSRPAYAMKSMLRFRVIPYEHDLTIRPRVFTTIEVVNPMNVTVRRWMSPRTNAHGYISLSFRLPPTTTLGKWKVRCTRESFVTEKEFLVSFKIISSMFSVNITMPQRLSNLAFGVYGIIESNHTTNTPAVGNATVRLQFRAKHQSAILGTVWKNIPFFSGRSEFFVSMNEVKQAMRLSARPANVEVRADAFVMDWEYLINQSSYANSFIFDELPAIRFLGGAVRQFKPGFPFTALILVYQPDGQKPSFRHRSVSVEVSCEGSTDKLIQETNLPIPDDSVVRFSFQTDSDCISYRLQAILQTPDSASKIDAITQYVFRHYSATGAYMQVTTSTDEPTVDTYMVFNVRTNYYTDRIHFLILAAGGIVHSDVLSMPPGVTSKTFSIALAREMAPVARIVAFFMKQDGELVTDSLSFFVNLLDVSSVSVKMTEGSDLSGGTVSGWVSGAKPGSFALLSAIPYDLYQRYGDKVILEQSTILEELRGYESHAEQPLRHRWFNDSSDVPFSQYFPSNSLGPDANKTMNFSGLIMFTDSNYTKVTYWHSCNETENPDRAFPCYSRSHDSCYSRKNRCDGNFDCDTGVDEMNCETERLEDLPGYVEPKFRFELRHFSYDDTWLWQDIYVKPFPDGRMPIHTANVPKLEMPWVIGSLALDGRLGLRTQAVPARFTSRRRFYMVLEAAKSVKWGEQLGVRVALFNRWNYWTEAIVEMKQDPNLEFVQVRPFGQVTSYAPDTLANVGVHTVVYIRAASTRTIYMPVLPRKVGTNIITICGYSFIGGECDTLKVDVSMNGIANSYHSPILLDLVSQSTLMSHLFHIMPEQDFVEPEKRWRRFVPGSKTATFTVVGDIVGPAFSDDLPVGDVSSVVWKPHGSAESVLFNINWNVQMLHYLRMTRQLKAATQNRVLNFVNTQFARVAFFIDPTTGGIANFPEKFVSETSVFLTAFGLFTLAEAAFSEWEKTISIGSNVFEKLLTFLSSVQDSGDDPQLVGSFHDDIRYDMKYFDAYVKDRPSIAANKTILQRVSLTALVVIATRHSDIPKQLSGLAARIATPATDFLRRHLRQLEADPLGLAMTAYALTFDNTDSASIEATKMLQSIARNDNHLYWANRRVLALIREPDTAGRFLIKPRVEWPNDALAVQASAFALLALFKTGAPATDPQLRANISSIINFIVETKNSPHGWISTQDTVFAVRALREVTQLDFNRDIYRLRIHVSASAGDASATTFSLSGANLSEPQSVTFDNDKVWGELTVTAEGSGRAVLQLNAQKSVENAFQVKNAADPLSPSDGFQTFELTCTPSYSGRNGSFFYMKTCARWTWTERSETSGLAVISYSLPSGYQVSNYGLRNFVQRSRVRGLRHIWIEGGAMNLFFTNITSVAPTCVTLRVPRWFPIANMTIEQSCSVYEFFENDNGNFSIYDTRVLNSNDICEVCGSFQCPYCVNYNGGQRLGNLRPPALLLAPLLALLLVGNCM